MPCGSFLGPAAGRLTCIAVSLVRLPDTLGDLVSRASYPAKCPRLFLCVDFTLLVSPLPGQPEAKSLPQFVGLAYFFLAVATACKRFANHAQVDHIGFCNRTRCPRAVYGSSSNRPHRDHLQSWMSWPGMVSSKPVSGVCDPCGQTNGFQVVFTVLVFLPRPHIACAGSLQGQA